MTKLVEARKVELEKYSSIELAYLLQDVLKEFIFRDGKFSENISKVDKEISTVYHDIELNEFKHADKSIMFDNLKKVLQTRRLAKNEMSTLQKINSVTNLVNLYGKLGSIVGQLQRYQELESGKEVYKNGRFGKFYNNYYKSINNEELSK